MFTLKNQKAQAWLVLVCVWLGTFICSYAQNQLSGMSVSFMEQYGFTQEQYAGLYTASTFAGIWIAFIAGVLSDRVRVRWIVLVCAILAAAGLVGRIFVTDYMGQFICNMLPGFLATFIGVNRGKILGGWFPASMVGIAVGIAATTTPIANTVGVGLTAMMPDATFAFTVSAIIAVVFMIMWFCFGQERSADVAAAEAEARGGEKLGFVENLKKVAVSPWVWVLCVSIFFIMAAQVPVMAFTTVALVKARGLAQVDAGIMLTAATIGMGVGSIVTPIIVRAIKNYRPMILVCGILAAVCIYFGWQMPAGPIMYAVFFVLGFGLGSLPPIVFTYPVMIYGREFAGVAGGIVQTFLLMGASLALTNITIPLAGGAGNFSNLFTIAAIFCVVGTIALFIVPDQGKKIQAELEAKKEKQAAEEEKTA